MKIKKRSVFQIQLLIAVVAALLFIPFLGQVHLFDWDEINFAESAREMIVSGNYLEVQIDFKTFWEKPPLFIWMQVISMHVFGINEFAARFPNAICGIITLLAFFNIGRYFYNKEFGLWWVLVYMASIFPFFYFKTGIIDPWFNLFMFLGIFYLFRYLRETKTCHVALAALFTGLAVLTKGPVGALLVGLSIISYLILIRFRVRIRFWDLLLFVLISSISGGFWFLLMLWQGEGQMIADFIQYQINLFSSDVAGHKGFLLYHFVIVLAGVFPASIFALKAFRRIKDKNNKSEFRRLMLVTFWTVMIVFTIVDTKIIHYSSLAWFPLSFLATYSIMYIRQSNYNFSLWLKILLGLFVFLYSALVAVIPFFDKLKHRLIETGMIDDKFVLGNLKANAGWSGLESLTALILPAGFIIMLILFRKGKPSKAIQPFLISAIVFVFLVSVLFTPRVEKYTQHAAIEFYKSIQSEDLYVYPLGFKSYAHLFYTKKKNNLPEAGKNELLKGKTDKPAYFVIKSSKAPKKLARYPQLQVLYSKNGFVFCKLKKDSND